MFKLNLVTPDKKMVIDQEMEEVTVPSERGQLDILPGHAPMMTTLGAGVLSYRLKGGNSQKVAISWGYCQVSAEGVNVLAETALTKSEIDLKKAEENLKSLEKQLASESLDDSAWDKVCRSMDQTKAEIQLATDHK